MNLHIEFYLLCLCVCCFFVGWFAKIAIEQYKADQKREQEAEMRRMAYMHQIAKQKQCPAICIEIVHTPETTEHRQARFNSGAEAGNELYTEEK